MLRLRFHPLFHPGRRKGPCSWRICRLQISPSERCNGVPLFLDLLPHRKDLLYRDIYYPAIKLKNMVLGRFNSPIEMVQSSQ